MTNATPERVAVIGAGMVGLATAWFLRQRGVAVTVLDRVGVAAGSSWGNAGWLSPSKVVPLPDPAVLRYGLRAMVSPSSPVYVPPRPDPRLLAFMAGFVRHCTHPAWRRSLTALVGLNRRALAGFDALSEAGVGGAVTEADILAAFATTAEADHLIAEYDQMRAGGQEVEYEVITGDAARGREPALSDRVVAGVALRGQRFINPGEYLAALAEAVRGAGGEIRDGVGVTNIRDRGTAVDVEAGGRSETFDAVVIATGAWLGELARPFGVRTTVQAGRGYSFSVPVEKLPSGPLYFPGQRVACTPVGDRLRIAGMMEFRPPNAPLDPRRVHAITEAVRPLLTGADLDAREDEWVGGRPCTPDGLPLIGRTRSARVFVAGGHGMWGITLGPVTGQLLTELITTGYRPAELAPFDPLR